MCQELQLDLALKTTFVMISIFLFFRTNRNFKAQVLVLYNSLSFRRSVRDI